MERSRTVAPPVVTTTDPAGHQDVIRTVYPDLIQEGGHHHYPGGRMLSNDKQSSSQHFNGRTDSSRIATADRHQEGSRKTEGSCAICKSSYCCCGMNKSSSSTEDEFVKRNRDSVTVTFDDPMYAAGENFSRADQGSAQKLGRKWKHFQGKNNFYFNGRLMTAPSIKFCTMSFLLITVTFTLFMVSDGPFFAERLTIWIPITGTVLFVLVIVNMMKTTCSDPGILPRASAQEAEFIERCYATGNGVRPPPRTKDIVVNGQTIKSKYCFTCKMFRPPRASHCSVCDNCVDRFDHHCPFLGNCIGKRNYRNFYAFIVCLSLLAVFVLSFSIAKLAMLGKERGNFLEALRDSPTSAIVIIVSFFGMWTVIGLAGFHSYLIAVEQTTNEDIKGIFGRANNINPYSKGNMCQNCCYILCGPHHPSLIDPRGHVTPEFLTSLPKKHGGNNDTSVIVQNQTTSIHQNVLHDQPVHSLQAPHGMSSTENSVTHSVMVASPTASTSHTPKAGTVPGEPKMNISTSSAVGNTSTNQDSHLWAPKLKAKSISHFPATTTTKTSYTNPNLNNLADDEHSGSSRMVELKYLQNVSKSAVANGDGIKFSANMPLIGNTTSSGGSSTSNSHVDSRKTPRRRPISGGSGVPSQGHSLTAVNAPLVSNSSKDVVASKNLEKFTMINAPLDLDNIS